MTHLLQRQRACPDCITDAGYLADRAYTDTVPLCAYHLQVEACADRRIANRQRQLRQPWDYWLADLSLDLLSKEPDLDRRRERARYFWRAFYAASTDPTSSQYHDGALIAARRLLAQLVWEPTRIDGLPWHWVGYGYFIASYDRQEQRAHIALGLVVQA